MTVTPILSRSKGIGGPSGTRVTRAASRNAPPETTDSPTLFPLFSCREFPRRRAGLRARAHARDPNPTHRSLTSRTATPRDPQSGAGEPGARAPPALQPAAAGKPRRHEPLRRIDRVQPKAGFEDNPRRLGARPPGGGDGLPITRARNRRGLVAPLRRPRPQPRRRGEHRRHRGHRRKRHGRHRRYRRRRSRFRRPSRRRRRT